MREVCAQKRFFRALNLRALLVLIKTGTIDNVLQQQNQIISTPSVIQAPDAIAPQAMSVEKALSTEPQITHDSSTHIKKLSSQMGATVAYQKHFPDVQITVVWVLPQGV